MWPARAWRAVVCLSLVSLYARAAVAAQDPRATLDTAIPEAIRLLEAKEHATFLRQFVPPDTLKELTAADTFEGFAKEFGDSGKAAALLTALKTIKGTRPVIDAEGRRARFTLKEPIEGKTSITFVRLGGLWYISDD